eukprot:1180569-Prorocentrum_minimum.AAC.2
MRATLAHKRTIPRQSPRASPRDKKRTVLRVDEQTELVLVGLAQALVQVILSLHGHQVAILVDVLRNERSARGRREVEVPYFPLEEGDVQLRPRSCPAS